MSGLVEHILRTLSKFEEITRPPRMGHDVDSPHTPESHECGACGRVSPLCKPVNTWVGEQFYCPECPPYPRDGAEQLAEREAEEEVHEPPLDETRWRCANCLEWFDGLLQFSDHSTAKRCAYRPIDGSEPALTPDEPVGLDYTRPLCPANCDCGECYHNPERNCHCFDGAEQLAEREAEEEVSEPSYQQCRVHHPLHTDWLCTKLFGHDDQHGYAGCFWTEGPLSDDELVAVRGLIQERYEPESVAAYMARAQRVEGGYIIHDTPEQAARMNALAAATYSSATPPADDPAGVEHPPVPPAGIPATADTIANMLALEFWGKRIGDGDQIGRIAAELLLENFDITHK